MYKQAKSASRPYAGVLVFLAVCLICLPAHAALRGIPLIGGDSATTAITPPGDDDVFVLDAFEGAKLNVTVKALKGSALLPDVVVVDPNGDDLDVSAYRKVSGTKVVLSGVPLPMTGKWGIRVTGRDGSEGEYSLKTKLLALKKKQKTDVIDPGLTKQYTFSADGYTRIYVKLVGKGGPFEVLSVVDPMGVEMPGAADHFVYKKNKATARLYPSRNNGDYTITVGNISAATQIHATIKMIHAKIKGQKFEISPVEPQVDSLLPDYGREGNGIGIIGKGFQSGKIEVLFDDVAADVATYVSPTRLNAIVPAEGARIIVDITVFNPDGQSGTKAEIFTYIPPPPEIITVTPTEGPDNGGTEVTVIGENLFFVETIALGQDVLSTKPSFISEDGKLLMFTTDAHAPGLTTLTLTDKFGQTDFMSGAFYFAPPPVITVVEPPAGTKKGGGTVVLDGGGFRSDSQYLFGTVAAARVTVLNLAQVFLTTPAHPKGVVDVRVIDPWGREAVAPGAFEYVDGTLIDVSFRLPGVSAQEDVSGTSVAIGDIDGGAIPGRVDIILGKDEVGNYDTTQVLLNEGSSGFSLSTASKFDRKQVEGLAVGDIDDDGDLDVVVTQNTLKTTAFYSRYYYSKNSWNYYYYYDRPDMGTRLFINDGLGALAEAPDQLPVIGEDEMDILLGTAVAFGDVDDDDDLDLVVTGDTVISTSYMYNGYTWESGSTHWYYYYFYTYEDATLPATRLLTNNGSGTFEDVSADQMPDPTNGDIFAGDDVIIGDADNDGDLDILLTGDGANLRDSGAYEYVDGSKTRILTNDGDGYFTDSTSSLMPDTKSWDDWGGSAVALGDLDGDQVNDLVITVNRPVVDNSSGSDVHTSSTRVFKGGRDGFTEATKDFLPPVASDGSGETWKGIHAVVGDPDGDGLDEIFLLSTDPVFALNPSSGLEEQVTSLRWLSRQGALPLTNVSGKQLPNPDLTGDYYLGHRLALGDIDEDGDLDLVITTVLPQYTSTGARPTRLLEFR